MHDKVKAWCAAFCLFAIGLAALLLSLQGLALKKEYARAFGTHKPYSTKATAYKTLTISPHCIAIDNLKIKYRDGKLLYAGEIKLMEACKNKYGFSHLSCLFGETYSKVILVFRDKDGFPVTEVSVLPQQLRKIVDRSGSPMYFSFRGKVSLPYEAYREIESVEVNWRLPDKCR